jgi:hypothetical protein
MGHDNTMDGSPFSRSSGLVFRRYFSVAHLFMSRETRFGLQAAISPPERTGSMTPIRVIGRELSSGERARSRKEGGGVEPPRDPPAKADHPRTVG